LISSALKKSLRIWIGRRDGFAPATPARSTPDGYLTFVDRASSAIRVGSTTVYPPTVELRLYGLPCIADAAVGEVDGRLVAAVVADPGCEPQPAAILASLRESLPAAAVPTEVKTVEAIPRNAAGKVRRDELRAALVAEGSVGVSESVSRSR
jgi:acyl-CoA synthetase (AMP-forming)/AMP-acid ligase II